jgi:transposase
MVRMRAIDWEMKPLSRDLRERLVAAGATQRQVAERFGVSQWVVHKLCKQQRELGHLQTHYGERPSRPLRTRCPRSIH